MPTSMGQNAAAGAAAGSAAGPYGAAIGAGAGVIGGLIGGGQELPTIDISALLATIQGAGQYQQQIINSLPDAVKQQLQEYVKNNNAAGADYKAGIAGVGNDLMSKTAELYAPDSEAELGQLAGTKREIYSTLPGTQDAIRSALASTGGLSRGHAGTAIAAPAITAAQQYGDKATDIIGANALRGQEAKASAIKTISSMGEGMFTNLFGMSKAQAQQILTSGTQALQTQLTELINSSNTMTSATLGAEGLSANNAYQNAVTRNAQQDQVWNGITGLGLQGIQAGLGALGTGGTGLPSGADTSSPSYIRNVGANSPL